MSDYYCNFRFNKAPEKCTKKGVGNAFLPCDGEDNCLDVLVLVELMLQRGKRNK